MTGNKPGDQVRQFKEMVRELHAAGIEVILDVVFNHTAEGNETGPTFSFKGLENRVYYMLNDDGTYKNFTGCGNTVNGNHPIVREMIFHCLRHWVHNYHIDGFRFDLASILSRNRKGELVPNPPMVELIAEDPMLADTKIIAEAWDAAGAYQVGSFANQRWAEWNGHYRDDIRRYWRGDWGMTGPMATRLAGSSDLYQPSGRRPYHSINFITSHDGFTLNDLVSYERKHNLANSEDNRDGDNNNYSCNYGVEGPTRRKSIVDASPAAGQELHGLAAVEPGRADDPCRRRSAPHPARQQQRLLPGQRDQLVRLAARRAERRDAPLRAGAERVPPPAAERPPRRVPHRQSRQARPAAGRQLVQPRRHAGRLEHARLQPDLRVRHERPHRPGGPRRDDHAPRRPEPHEFTPPPAAANINWRLFIDTAADTPDDIYPEADGPPLGRDPVLLDGRTPPLLCGGVDLLRLRLPSAPTPTPTIAYQPASYARRLPFRNPGKAIAVALMRVASLGFLDGLR